MSWRAGVRHFRADDSCLFFPLDKTESHRVFSMSRGEFPGAKSKLSEGKRIVCFRFSFVN